MLAYQAGSDGIERGGERRSLCFDMLDRNGAEKDHPFYGSPELRKTLFVLMTVLLQNVPPDDPVFQFLDKKRTEGKPYYVYMPAGCNKFLRIYYGRVKEFMNTLDTPLNLDSTGLSQ